MDFYATSTGSRTLASSSWLSIGSYTVKSAGVAIVNCNALFASLGSGEFRRIAGITLNGSEYTNNETVANSTARLSAGGTELIKVSAGNVIGGRVYQNCGSSKTIDRSRFSVLVIPI